LQDPTNGFFLDVLTLASLIDVLGSNPKSVGTLTKKIIHVHILPGGGDT
jgi:hypothetical protein